MIAACPKCQAKYRVDAERLSSQGARLRCAKCRTVFRVRVPKEMPAVSSDRVPLQPGAEAGIDRERLIVIADPDIEAGKRTFSDMASWGLQPVLVHDGVEALLTIQRMLPRAALLSSELPKMYAFQICEMVKRNESLRATKLAVVGAEGGSDRHRRASNELYGADVYIEGSELSEQLGPVLSGFGYAIRQTEPLREPAPDVARPAALDSRPPVPQAESVAAPAVREDDGLSDSRADAERLARVIVSDILLYHPAQFESGLASGQLAEALEIPIAEGRSFFAQRADSRVRDERDYILEELARVAKERVA